MRTDTIGVDRFASQATFVLADAQNLADFDAEVTIGGILVDADGREVAPLRPESLRIPAHGRRTFALIDRGRAARPTAVAKAGARCPSGVNTRSAWEPWYIRMTSTSAPSSQAR